MVHIVAVHWIITENGQLLIFFGNKLRNWKEDGWDRGEIMRIWCVWKNFPIKSWNDKKASKAHILFKYLIVKLLKLFRLSKWKWLLKIFIYLSCLFGLLMLRVGVLGAAILLPAVRLLLRKNYHAPLIFTNKFYRHSFCEAIRTCHTHTNTLTNQVHIPINVSISTVWAIWQFN